MSGYVVTSLLDLERYPVEHGLEWRPIRRALGIRAFGVNAYTAAKVGDWVVEEHTTVLAVGGTPGKAFEPSAWEWHFAAYPQADAGDVDSAVETMRQGLEEHSDHPTVLYHLACMECRAGLVDDARTHIRRAIELRPELAERARGDADLEAVRDAL